MNYPDLDLRSFLVLITAAVIQIITSGVINTCGLFPPEFMEFFNLSASTATYPATAIYVTTSAVGLIAVPIADLLGWPGTICLGICLTLTGLIATYFIYSFPWIIVTFGVLPGAGLGLISFISIIAVQLYVDQNIAFANGLISCGYQIGPAVFGPVVGFVRNSYSWRSAVLLLTGLSGMCAFSCFILKPPSDISRYGMLVGGTPGCTEDTVKQEDAHSELTKSMQSQSYSSLDTGDPILAVPAVLPDMMDIEEKEIVVSLTDRASQTNLLRNPLFLLLCLSYSLFVIHFMTVYMQIILKANYSGISEDKSVWLLTTMSASAITFRMTLVLIIKDFKVLVILAGLTGCLGAIVSMLMPLFSTFPLMVMYSVIWGACLGYKVTFYFNLANRMDTSYAKKHGMACLTISSTAGCAALPITGLIISKTGSVDNCFVFGGAVGLIASIIFSGIVYAWQKT